MANWNTTDAAGTSAPTPVWVAAELAGSSASAGTARWNTVEVAAQSGAAGTAAWRVLDLCVQALSAVDRAYMQVQGRDGSLYPAYVYVQTATGKLV